MALTRTADAATEPVTLVEAKAHLRVTGIDDDTLIGTLITTARQFVENFTNRALITQTWEWRLDRFYPWTLIVPMAPLASVTSIQYVDGNGDTQTLALTEYTVDAKSDPARITPAYGKSWPATRYHINAVTITFTAGYGTASAVPSPIKQALLLVLAEMYERREAAIAGAPIIEIPLGVKALLMPYVVIEY